MGGGSRGSKYLGFMAIRRRKEASKPENCCFGALSLCHLGKRRRKKSRGEGSGAQNGLDLWLYVEERKLQSPQIAVLAP